MGVHRQRLGASRAHKRFSTGVKMALQKSALEQFGRQISVSAVSPAAIAGVQLLSIPVPPMLEEALGYRGTLRFVEFGFSARTLRYGYCDGGDDIPSDQDLWIKFLRHPAIATHLPEKRYPTLYGVFPGNRKRAVKQHSGRSTEKKDRYAHPAHCLLLDREKRQLYLCRKDHTIFWFALTEPEDEDQHRIFVDGLLMNAGCENYKVPPPKDVADELLAWLDDQLRR